MTAKPNTFSDVDPLDKGCENPDEQQRNVESALDEALDESFPASDPVAITIEKPPCPPI
ncbi:MAG: hypothetical protein ABI171_06060 [Collimonas sp.]|uniref:hypothetical protein n=1 Tax=Collimonas sp. TaxID=1963772 RepID=UPI003266928D